MIQNLTQPQNHLDKFLNPLNPLELQEVLESVISTIANRKEYRHLLGILKSSIEKKEPKIILKTTQQYHILNTKDIIHLEADGAYTSFFTTTKKIVVSKNIKYYQDILGERFTRCHQSHLINTKHVLGINKNGLLQLTNNKLIPISTRNKTKINKLINDFQTFKNVS